MSGFVSSWESGNIFELQGENEQFSLIFHFFEQKSIFLDFQLIQNGDFLLSLLSIAAEHIFLFTVFSLPKKIRKKYEQVILESVQLWPARTENCSGIFSSSVVSPKLG